ncbi:hypothetical protein NV379_01060 [Paenibacillus sp. N1-5-1-14]|uniref:hypothetical protein n=1 Tax=Paenibacillus radicibacter TaxID=2972488 RepID=UPI0021594D91|nr:hypothetical protein [Paenibacillus radicibacter]MCR8641232.1 hypothetical protein [Paenibacillus radicibacter]
MKRSIASLVLLVLILVIVLTANANKKVTSVAEHSPLTEVRTNICSILYGTDKNSINLILNLNLPLVEDERNSDVR